MSHLSKHGPRRLILVFVSIVLVILIGSQVHPIASHPAMQATAAATPSTQDLASKIDSAMTDMAKAGKFSGSVLVAKEGQVIISKGYGMADLENDVPNTPQTKFRIASLTKAFTAMAIMILQEQGKLTVQDKICKYYTPCPDAWKDITLHHLLTHTSGVPDYGSGDFADFSKQSVPVRAIIARFRDLPLMFKPGEKWSYSSSNYILLGFVIEQVAGGNYAPFVRTNILQSLGMADTGMDAPTILIKHRATGYSGSNVKAEYIDMSTAFSAGGLYSTVEDLYRWDQALYTTKLVSQASLDAIFKGYAIVPGAPTGYDLSYGYGWFIAKDHNHLIIGHNGGINGFASSIARYPADHVTVIWLCNNDQVNYDAITNAITDQIFGKP